MGLYDLFSVKKNLFSLKHLVWRIKYSEMIKTGKAPLPKKIIIEATLRCNLRCTFCFRDTAKTKELNTQELKKIIDNLGPSIKRVGLTGGEIFLRSDIFEIFDYVFKKGFSLGILSNATLLNEEKVEKLVKYKDINIGISLDGLEETHNSIRGTNAFNKTLNALKLINKRIRVGVNTVVTDKNIDQIIPLLNIISPYIHSYCIEFEMFNNKQEVDSSAHYLEIPTKKISSWITDKKGYSYEKTKIKSIMTQIKHICKEKNIGFMPSPSITEILFDEFYDGKIQKKQPLCGHLLTAR
jgi:MoaA/NifB/PqqE/SkfB family radical SAM enzyme